MNLSQTVSVVSSRDKDKVTFKDIQVGKYFVYKNNLYMKLYLGSFSISNILCKRNAVDCEGGLQVMFIEDEEVKAVKSVTINYEQY